MDPTYLAVAGLAALAILLITLAASRSGDAATVSGRIQRYGTGQDEGPGDAIGRQNLSDLFSESEVLNALNKAVEGRDFGANLARDLARADLQLRVSEFLIIWAAVVVGVPTIFLLLSGTFASLGSPVALLVGGLIGAVVPRLWLSRREATRLNAFNNQLPDAIVLLANALRAGSSFLQACELLVREAPPPLSTEFARVVREVNLGLPFEMAIDNMVRRIRSDDFELMATAISIQYQVGGNLAEILDSIAYTIRERIRIKGEIRTLTAQQRLSAYVVGFLPIGLAAFLVVFVPGFMTPMFRKPPDVLGIPAGEILLAGAALMMAAGFVIIRRIVDIDV